MDKLATYIVREGALSTYDAVGWVVRLAATLEPIHGLGVSHGRVSAKAIQIEEADCRSQGFLLDAGDLTDDPAYFSKDRCKGGVRSPVNDTWSVAVILYQCLTGSLPFPGTTKRAVLEKLEGSPPAPLAVFDAGDDALQVLLDRLLAPATVDRLDSIRELKAELIRRMPSYADLPPLSYGRPEEAGGLAEESDEDDSTTSVIDRNDIRAALEKVRNKEAAKAAGASKPDTPQAPALEPPAPKPPAPKPPAPKPPPLAPKPQPPKPQPPKPQPPKPQPPKPPAAKPPAAKPPTLEAPAPAAPAAKSDPEPVDELARTVPLRDAPPALRALAAGKPKPVVRQGAASPDELADELMDEETRDVYRAVPADLSDIDVDEPDDDDWDVPQRDSAELIAASIVDTLSKAPPKVPTSAPSAKDGVEIAIDGGPAKLPPVVRGGAITVPVPKKRRSYGSWLVALLFMLAGGGAAYVLLGWPPKGLPGLLGGATPAPSTSPPSTTSNPSEPPTTVAAPASATSSAPQAAGGAGGAGEGGSGGAAGGAAPSASAATSASAASSASATASAGSPANGDVFACVEPMFPPESFVRGRLSFEFMCEETNPYRGASQVHTLVVLGGGRGVTDAMREWSTLGWYNMAAFAVIRARCCSSPPPLSTSTTLTRCKFDERLAAVGKAAVGGSDAEAQAAVKEYTEAVHCLARGGVAHLFGQVGYPQGGEATSFNKTLSRARAQLGK